MKIIIATIKSWNIDNAKALMDKYGKEHDFLLLTEKDDLSVDKVSEYNPDFIFFPHWSYFIPEEIFGRWQCVVFHMTDLPFGRGGSPLQNLIVRGIKETCVSAIKVTKEMDAGPIYMKSPMGLEGSATEIFVRSSNIIFNEMIPEFLNKKLTPLPQEGEVVEFKRRKKEDGEIKANFDIETIYDYIRMLDAEGYPNAFIPFGDFCLEFSEASMGEDGCVEAKVRIRKEK